MEPKLLWSDNFFKYGRPCNLKIARYPCIGIIVEKKINNEWRILSANSIEYHEAFTKAFSEFMSSTYITSKLE